MNIFMGPLKICFRVMGVRSRGAIQLSCQLNKYKYLSVNNWMHCKNNNQNDGYFGVFDTEDFEERIDNKKNVEFQSEVPTFGNKMEQDMNIGNALAGNRKKPFDKLDYDAFKGSYGLDPNTDVIEHFIYANESVTLNQRTCYILLRKYFFQNPIEKIFISDESIIVNLVKKGLKPECLFVNDISCFENIDSSLLDFPIHDVGYLMNSMAFGKPVIGFFDYSELKALSENVEAKIPITIISDYNNVGSFVVQLHRLAAVMGCEKFIFNQEIPNLRNFKAMSEIDMSLLKTEFESDLGNMVKEIKSDYKVLLLTYGPLRALGKDLNFSKFKDKFHVLNEDNAWDKEKIALVVTKNNMVCNYILDVVSETNDVKYVHIPFGNELSINQKASLVLFQLHREYIIQNPLPKKRTKRATPKKSDTE